MVLLLRLILIAFAIYFLAKVIGKLLFPSSGNDNRFFDDKKKREGDVIVEKKDDSQKNISRKEGEYIDFEEVD